MDLKDTEVERQMTMGKKDAGHQEMIEKAALSPLLAPLTPEEFAKADKRVTRVLDLLIMGPMIIIYIFNYLDRQSISAAKLAGIEEDLNLTDTEYQTAISLLFLGYCLCQVPSNLVVSKIKWPGVYICAAMAAWGVVSACTAATKDFGGLVATRFFLGIVEAAFFPGALYYLSLLYTRKAFATRVALLYSGSQLGNAFGGLLAIGILKLDGVHGIQGWRWLFLLEGAVTVGLAIVFAFILPSSPATCPMLSDTERELLLWRIKTEQGAADKRDELTASQAFSLALVDPKTWCFIGILYSTYIAAAVTQFFPTVVASLNYDRTLTYVLTAPPYLFTVITMVINGHYSDKRQNRWQHILGPMVVAVIANVIAVSTLALPARYLAMMLMPSSYYAAAIVILSWMTESITQPAPKRAAAMAFINALCNTPNIWTSYLYTGAPRFTIAFSVNLAASALAVVFTLITRIYLMRKNADLDKNKVTARGAPTDEQVAAGFRYTL